MNFRNSFRKISAIFILLGFVTCCSLIVLFMDSRYLPNQPCRPILYVDGSELKKTFQHDFHLTEDKLNSIETFYNRALNPIPVSESYSLDDDRGFWVMQQANNDGYVYECRGKDSLGVNVKGCIYVYQQDKYNVIETVLYQSSEEVMPCRNTALPPS